jgi:hypothetical protein
LNAINGDVNGADHLPTQDKLVGLDEIEVKWHWFVSEAPHIFHGEELEGVIVEYLRVGHKIPHPHLGNK